MRAPSAVAGDRQRRSLGKILLKPCLALLLSLPLLWLANAIRMELINPGVALGADPGEAVVLFLGEWGLRFLLLSLFISPLRRRAGWNNLARSRRLVGLYAFSYLALHFLAYLGFLAEFDWLLIVGDLTERPYIIVGALGLLLLIPLAVTSTSGWQRRLRRNWQRLHRLVYLTVALGLLHLLWLTKDGFAEFAVYLLIFLALMVERLLARKAAPTAQVAV
jgi:sulfoxide reductase heme-binding subunit YedZ